MLRDVGWGGGGGWGGAEKEQSNAYRKDLHSNSISALLSLKIPIFLLALCPVFAPYVLMPACPVCLSIIPSFGLPVCKPIFPLLCLSVSLLSSWPVCLSAYLPVGLSACQPTCPLACLSVSLPECLADTSFGPSVSSSLRVSVFLLAHSLLSVYFPVSSPFYVHTIRQSRCLCPCVTAPSIST